MAKVDTINITIEGKDYSYNVNVGKEGVFRCELHWRVAKIIGYEDNKFEYDTLSELLSSIRGPYHDYLDSKITEEMFIMIQYKSDGYYYGYSDGRSFTGRGVESPYYNGNSGFTSADSLCFSFDVLIKRTHSTGNEVWYATQKGQGCVNFGEGELCDPDTHYKDRVSYSSNNGKIIPYSKAAYDTLSKAREGIRGVSEILYSFINQDEKLIEATLTKGNLLN